MAKPNETNEGTMASYQAVSGPPQAKASAPMIGSGVHGTAPPAGAFDEPPVASSPFAAPERENRRQCRLCLDDGSYNLNARFFFFFFFFFFGLGGDLLSF